MGPVAGCSGLQRGAGTRPAGVFFPFRVHLRRSSRPAVRRSWPVATLSIPRPGAAVVRHAHLLDHVVHMLGPQPVAPRSVRRTDVHHHNGTCLQNRSSVQSAAAEDFELPDGHVRYAVADCWRLAMLRPPTAGERSMVMRLQVLSHRHICRYETMIVLRPDMTDEERCACPGRACV